MSPTSMKGSNIQSSLDVSMAPLQTENGYVQVIIGSSETKKCFVWREVKNVDGGEVL